MLDTVVAALLVVAAGWAGTHQERHGQLGAAVRRRGILITLLVATVPALPLAVLRGGPWAALAVTGGLLLTVDLVALVATARLRASTWSGAAVWQRAR